MITKHSFFILLSMFALFYTPNTQSASTINKTRTTKTIKLYTYPNCGACHKVINFLKKKNWYDRVIIINADEEENYENLKKISGKDYCPYLVDDVHGKNMGDSRKIMDYFKEIFNDEDNAL